jgi:hypothetical protein
MDKVTTSLGEFGVAEPTLEAWAEVLGVVSDDHYKALASLMLSLLETPVIALASGSVLATLLQGPVLAAVLPILRSSPRLVAALAEGCLRTAEGNPVAKGTGLRLTASDAFKVLASVVEGGALRDLGEQLKNLLRPLAEKAQKLQAVESEGANASTPSS